MAGADCRNDDIPIVCLYHAIVSLGCKISNAFEFAGIEMCNMGVPYAGATVGKIA